MENKNEKEFCNNKTKAVGSEANLNPEQVVLKEMDRSLEMKTVLENKAASYMVVVTLILNILISFKSYFSKNSICYIFRVTFFTMFLITFILGIILLFIFAFMLLPRYIEYFDEKDLLAWSKDSSKTAADKEQLILRDCEKCIETNDGVVEKLRVYNKVISRGILGLLVCFGFTCILFFILIGVTL